MRCPSSTFSLSPLRSSTAPRSDASVSTFVVSWNEAAEMNDSAWSDALVMPSSSVLAVAGRVRLALAGVLPSASATALASLRVSRSTRLPAARPVSPASETRTFVAIAALRSRK